MSIASLIVQPDAAYIIADSGLYREDGTIFDLWPKTLMAHNDLFAYAAAGECGVILRWLADEGRKRAASTRFDPEGFLALVREAYDTIGLDPDTYFSCWVAAGWSREFNRPVGLEFVTSEREAAKRGYPTWQWEETLWLCDISGDELAGLGYRPRDLADPSKFQPKTDSMALVDLVRQQRAGWAADRKGCFVAGKVTLTKVTQHGVKMSVLHEYPDRIGELAGLHDAPQTRA